MKNIICKKIYLELRAPGNGDSVADIDRILQVLKPEYGEVQISIETIKLHYKLLRDFDWKLTVTMVQKGFAWEIVRMGV